MFEKIRLTAIAAAVMAVGSLAGCARTPVISVEETIRVSDSPQMLSSPAINIVETIGVGDSPQLITSVALSVTETIRVSDSPALMLSPVQPPPSPIEITVTVTSPKSGEVWRVGTPQSIAWTTTGEGIDHVDIYYSTDGGKSMADVAQRELNDGIYTWKVPNTPSKTVLVRVLAFGAKGETLALGDSGLFTISAQ